MSDYKDVLKNFELVKSIIDHNLSEIEDKERFLDKIQIAKIPMNEMLYLFDLKLPKVDDLFDMQIDHIISSISDLLSKFNCFLKFPEGNIPIDIKYKLFREKFTKEISFKEEAKFYYDFCPGWCPDCELADYCDARKELWADDEDFNFCKRPLNE